MVVPSKHISEFENGKELRLRERVLLSVDEDTDNVIVPEILPFEPMVIDEPVRVEEAC